MTNKDLKVWFHIGIMLFIISIILVLTGSKIIWVVCMIVSIITMLISSIFSFTKWLNDILP